MYFVAYCAYCERWVQLWSHQPRKCPRCTHGATSLGEYACIEKRIGSVSTREFVNPSEEQRARGEQLLRESEWQLERVKRVAWALRIREDQAIAWLEEKDRIAQDEQARVHAHPKTARHADPP